MEETTQLKTLGMRHIALNVQNPQESKKFYCDILQMNVEWEPSPDEVYLTSKSLDNLALHKTNSTTSESDRLNHIGFFVPTLDEVDVWYRHLKEHGVEIAQEIKTHRDGARSFYFRGPDQVLIQILFHPPIKT